MDTITSTEFRKVFHRLIEATIVTVNGHSIGTWDPTNRTGLRVSHPELRDEVARQARGELVVRAKDYRPSAFRPAPKPGKR